MTALVTPEVLENILIYLEDGDLNLSLASNRLNRILLL
jgi:hypothetical protein